MKRSADQVRGLLKIWGSNVPEHVLFNFFTDRTDFSRSVLNKELKRLNAEGLRLKPVERFRLVKKKR